MPRADREEYLTLLDWNQTGFNIMKQHHEDDPANPNDMYAYFWALESYLPFAAAGKEWQPSLFSLRTKLGQKFDSETALLQAVRQNPEFRQNLELAEQMRAHLKTSDDILERLKPFDDNTYSYFQAVYSTHRNRAYLAGGLSFEFTKAEHHYRSAFAVPDQYLQYAPENDQVRLESISLRLQLVFLLQQSEKILEGSRKEDICILLSEAHELAFAKGVNLTTEQISDNKLDRISTQRNLHECAL